MFKFIQFYYICLVDYCGIHVQNVCHILTRQIKDMEKLCITPVDENIKLRVESLNLLNEFKMLGFTTRSGFVGVIQDNLEEFKAYKKLNELFAFWDGRKHCNDLNNELRKLLNTLKDE